MKCSEFESMIDALIDGEIDKSARDAMRKHADSCESCSEKLRAAEMLQDILSHMDDSVAVPLQAQAGWRRAVAAEARKKKFAKIYRVAGAAVAALVLAICLPMLLRSPTDVTKTPDAHVEVDGVNETAKFSDEASMKAASAAPEADLEDTVFMSAASPMLPDAERKIAVENVETAYGYAMDLVKEYSGTLESEAEDAGEKCAYVQIPAENAEDFISAIDQLGTVSDSSYLNASTEKTVEICVRLVAE